MLEHHVPTYIEVQYKHSAWEPEPAGRIPEKWRGGSEARRFQTGLPTCEPFLVLFVVEPISLKVPTFIIDGQ